MGLVVHYLHSRECKPSSQPLKSNPALNWTKEAPMSNMIENGESVGCRDSFELHEKGEKYEEVPSEKVDKEGKHGFCDSSNTSASCAVEGQIEKNVSSGKRKADPKSERISTSIFWENLKNRKGHLVKTIILGLSLNLFDVGSDIGVGISHAQEKKVKRFFSANDTIPDYCIPVSTKLDPYVRDGSDGVLTTLAEEEADYSHTHECLEEDPLWAIITLSCVHLPALVLGLCLLVGVVLLRCFENADWYAGYKKVLGGAVLLLITPFPVVVLTQQVASLFMQEDAQMELLSAIFLFGEQGSLIIP